MREILFRAKRIDNGEWVEGDLRQDRDLETAYISGWDYYTTEGGLEREPFECEIKLETLCQFTGLKDKNGNRIWENDIVRTTKFGKDDGNGHNYAGFDVFVVKWDDGGFALFNKWRRFNLRTDEKSYEILGKVFDNPELMKGE